MLNKHLSLSQESYHSTVPVLELSQEEEAMLVNETSEDISQIDDQFGEIDRLEDTATGMEDVLIIAQSPEKKEGDVLTSLTDIAASMAVAGTEAESAELIADPTLSEEAFEGIKNTIKKIWESVLNFLKKLWAKIKAYFGKNLSLLRIYKKRFTEMQGELSQVKNGYALKSSLVIKNFSRGDVQGKGPLVRKAGQVSEDARDVEDAVINLLVNGNRDNDAFLRAVQTYLNELIPAFKDKEGKERIGEAADTFVSTVKRFHGTTNAFDKSALGTDYTPLLPGGYQASSTSGTANDTLQDLWADRGRSTVSEGMTKMDIFTSAKLSFKRKSKHPVVDIEVKEAPDTTALKVWHACTVNVIDTALVYLEKTEKTIAKQIEDIAQATSEVTKIEVMDKDVEKYRRLLPQLNTFINNNMLKFNGHVVEYAMWYIRAMEKPLNQVIAAAGVNPTKVEKPKSEEKPVDEPEVA